MTTELTTRSRTRAQTNMSRQLEKMSKIKTSMETDQDEILVRVYIKYNL